MAKILVVEDDAELRAVVRCWLANAGYIVEDVGSVAEASAFIRSYSYDIILLDWELPDGEGIDLCRFVREKAPHSAVLFLTGRNAVLDKELGLDSGAEDYLTKPFDMRELSARIRVLLRRKSESRAVNITVGPLELDPVKHLILKDGTPLKLQRMEFALLEFLMRHPGQSFASDALLERVWSSDSERVPETIRNCIKSIRKKIDDAGEQSLIQNTYGVGYKLEPPC